MKRERKKERDVSAFQTDDGVDAETSLSFFLSLSLHVYLSSPPFFSRSLLAKLCVPTCHVMVSMALTNQRRLRKGWKTPYTPDGEWKAFPVRLKEGRKSVPTLF